MKKKLKIKNIIFILLLLIIIFAIGIYVAFNFFGTNKEEVGKKGYLASSTNIIDIYNYQETDDEYQLVKDSEVIRGNEIIYFLDSKLLNDNIEYVKIKYQDKYYYVASEYIVDNLDDVVLEKELYVLTSNNMYKSLDYDLSILLNKGDLVNVVGFDKLNKDGSVNMYKVNINDTTGYFYSKYLVNSKEEALKNYDEEGIHQIHLKRTDKLGGGDAFSLDYYPREKVSFDDNIMPTNVYSLYINGSKGIKNSIDNYIEYAKTTKINAFVVDIKDNSVPAYESLVMKELSPTNYKYANNTIDDYKYAINKLKENGFYVIGRITTFKDSYYVNDHPEHAISKSDGSKLKHQGSYWPSPYVRDVWEFNVKLAKEAVELFGFNEIQFDYVRFPDGLRTREKNGTVDYKNTYSEQKTQAIQRFLMYATDELHKMNVYVSADVFGESSWGYVTAYGQYWPAISNVVDAISAMPYTDHFGSNSSYWENPYKTIYDWAKTAAERQKEIPTPAIARTWITAYDTPYWKPYVTYNGEMLTKQIEALYDAGLTGGYMTWNSGSNLTKYKSQFSAFNKEYS